MSKKRQMWTRLIEIVIGILATEAIVFAILFYAIDEPARLERAQNEILAAQLNEAMTLYAENCTVCHGMSGEGIGATPPLDNDGLRAMDYAELVKVINRGRYDTAMPAWNKSDGGPLSDYQAEELAALIQYGDWTETQDRVVNLGLAPLAPLSAEPDPVLYATLAELKEGTVLQQAVTIYADRCVACHGADGLGTSLAPALNDSRLRETAPDDLKRIISVGVSGTLMAGWNNTLAEDEISALATLISRWDEVGAGVIPAPDAPIATTQESLALGTSLFASNCAMCHGAEGQGTRRAPALNVKSFLTETSDLALQQIVTQGVPGTAMPAWGDRMSEVDIQAVVGFIRQWEATAPEVAAPTTGGGGPPWARNGNWVPRGQQARQDAGATQVEPDARTAAEGVNQNAAADTQKRGAAGGVGQGPTWARDIGEPAWWETLDEKVLTFIFGGAAIALLLIVIGYSALRRMLPRDGDDFERRQKTP